MYTTMLELAISMVFLYLMLSAASSAIQEIIANLWRWRAKTLEDGIASLLRSKDVKDELYKLPLLQSLFSPNARGEPTHKPSYIPSSSFALAVLHLAEKNGFKLDGAPAEPKKDGSSSATDDKYEETRKLLQSLLRGAADVETQRKRIEDWFDNSMDRISGWYKRRSHAALWIIGILLCLLVNADSISLANAFWNDQTLRAAMVTAATEHVKGQSKPTSGATAGSTGNAVVGQNAGTSPRARTTPPSTPTATNPEVKGANNQPRNAQKAPATADNSLTGDGTGAGTSSGVSGAQVTNSDNTAFKRLDDVRKELTKTNIPLGWCWYTDQSKLQKKCFPIFNSPSKPRPGPKDAKVTVVTVETGDKIEETDLPDPRLIVRGDTCGQTLLWWWWKLVGIALTGLAISQGAPFWFDLLQKAVNLRLAGDAPDEKQKKK